MAIKEKRQKRLLWKDVYEELFSQLEQFGMGDNFYTLADIVKKYGVSQNTAIKALSELQNEGFVKKIKRKGTIVVNNRKKFSIKIIVSERTTPEEYLSLFSGMKMYSALTARAKEIGVEIALVSEKYLSSIFPSPGKKIGILLFHGVSEKTEKFLQVHSIPFVLLHPGNPVKSSISCASVNIKKGGYLATKHLFSCGHKRIAFIGGSITLPFAFPRFRGYVKALREAGIRFDWSLIKETIGSDPEEDENAVKALLSLKKPPTAIFAGNDNRAIHILNYCNANKIRVPEDMSIAGYDNMAETSLVQPSLTTIDAHLEKVSKEGLSILLELMDGKKKVKNYVEEPELIIRESSVKNPGKTSKNGSLKTNLMQAGKGGVKCVR